MLFRSHVNEQFKLASATTINKGKSILVEQESLNEVISQWQPSFLIMDIEGAEYDIFSIIDFQSISKIQFELHSDILGKDKCAFIFDQLNHSGFKMDDKVSVHPNYFFSRNAS